MIHVLEYKMWQVSNKTQQRNLKKKTNKYIQNFLKTVVRHLQNIKNDWIPIKENKNLLGLFMRFR